MNYVQPSYAENVCDSTREEEIVVICGTAISAIFEKKVTRLLCMWYDISICFDYFLKVSLLTDMYV